MVATVLLGFAAVTGWALAAHLHYRSRLRGCCVRDATPEELRAWREQLRRNRVTNRRA